MVVRNYSHDVWLQILEQANLQEKREKILNHYYHDNITYDIVNIISNLTKIPKDQVWESFGTFFVGYVMEVGWDELLRSFSPTLRGFLENLNSMHYFIDHFVYKADLRGPTFRCEKGDNDSIILHYFTYRLGIYPIVKGIIKEIAKRIYNIEVQISVLAKTQKTVQMLNEEKTQEHLIFAIKIADDAKNGKNNNEGHSLTKQNGILDNGDLKLTQQDFCDCFPYHLVIDRDCKVIQVGSKLW
uniref:Guanylate cyclase n=1 Tax=Panagrolaimus sp. JU765 TaxID=591449 RepID=A0AC34Q941_9BILA